MKRAFDFLNSKNSDGSIFEIDLKMRVDLIINSLQVYSKGILFAPFVMSVALSFFVGFFNALIIFTAFNIMRLAIDNLVVHIKQKLENNTISLEFAETILMVHPLGRTLFFGLIYVFLYQSGNWYVQYTGILIVISNLYMMIYKSAPSLKLILSAVIPALLFILGGSIADAISENNFLLIITPFIFCGVMLLLSLLTYRGKISTIKSRLEIEAKSEKLEQLIAKQNEDNKIRESIERIAAVGTYSWYFYDGASVWSPGAFVAFGFDENSRPPNKDEFIVKIAPYDRRRYLKTMHDSRVQGKGFEFSFDLKHENRGTKTVTCHGTPIFDESGKVKGIEGIVIDQTEVKKAINEASEAQELLHTALSNGRSVVIDRNLATGEMQGFGALDIFDISRDDNSSEVEKKVMKCLGRRDTHIVFGAMGRAETSGETQFAEHSIVQANGNEIKVRVAMGVEGQIKKGNGHFVSITTDITEEVKRREELAEALKESTRASRVKSEFLANMSHEIRTPLNGVIAVAGLLARTNLEKDQREMVEMIETSGVALNHIINDVLDLSRVESGRLEIEQIEFNLKEALQSVTALFSVKADEKGLDFKIEIDDEADNIFIGDPIRIRQIIGNLISNAIKFTQNGQVALEAEFEKIDENGNLNCRFKISDTGDGMTPEALSRLFERFEQADGSITRKHGGSGLGLSISRALANLMGGDIKVTSKLEEGSEFTFEIPLKRSINNEVKTPYKNDIDIIDSQNEGEGQALKILGVDDNATNRKVLEMVLNPLGVDLTLCENGLEALNSFKFQKYDIILMDLQMPIMDGLTAISKIREYEAQNSLNPTPIIAVSANAMSHHVDEAIQFGANFHIAKPFTPQGLIEGIENALNEFEVAQHVEMLDCA